METHEQGFYPESVDAEIDQFLQVNDQEEIVARSAIHLVHEMRDLYLDESQVLERAWQRLSQQVQTSSREMPVSLPQHQNKKGKHPMKNQAIVDDKKSRAIKRLSTLGLVLVAALLLASVVLVFNLRQQHPAPARSVTGGSGPAAPGHVVYSSPKMYDAFFVGWSSDGQRVAVIGNDTHAIDGGAVHIWDALTGKHQVSVKLDADEGSSISPVWSPHGELLAVPTSKRVLIINGQTGKIVTTYKVNTSPSKYPPSFWGIAWSPDGKLVATAYGPKGTDTPAGGIQIWNSLTGVVSETLSLPPHWNIGEISWSPDGADIAGNMVTGGSLVTSQVQVWDVKTQQVVFHYVLPSSQEVAGSVWQPGTHNLAFSSLTDGALITAVLQIWNIQTGKIVKSIPGIAAGSMAWSPDGKEIAYEIMTSRETTAGVTLLNVTTGQKIYTYSLSAQKNQNVSISVPAWSPDGTYIATIETFSSSIPTNPSGNVSGLGIVCKSAGSTTVTSTSSTTDGLICTKITPTPVNLDQNWTMVKVWTA